jgi:hypothetical protein
MAPLPKEVEAALIEAARKFADSWGCHFLACGFDEYERPTILRADENGAVYQESVPGYAAIGMGEDLARARLLRRKAQPTDSLTEMLFKVYDAKIDAELEPSVGWYLDAWAMVLHREQPVDVDDETHKLIWLTAAATTPIPGEPTPEHGPGDPFPYWRKSVQRFADNLMKGR